jgi:2-polyprenyl-3-methyl-5-hydroxy-6-metoxy-1,4-benzoquinol methylase
MRMRVSDEYWLTRAGRQWDEAAKDMDSAMHNIATNREHWEESEFYDTGEREINHIFGPDIHDGIALDYGCGIGRCTEALGRRWSQAVGVDIAPGMVKLAAERAKRLSLTNLRYIAADELDDTFTEPFDLIWSTLTLQHQPMDRQCHYIRSFVNLLAPDGIALVTMPSGPYYPHPQRHLSMFGAQPHAVCHWIQEAGGKVKRVWLYEMSGVWAQFRYEFGRK